MIFLLVVWRRLVVYVDSHELLDALVTGLFQFSPLPVLTGVHPLAIGRVDGLGRRRPVEETSLISSTFWANPERCIIMFERREVVLIDDE